MVLKGLVLDLSHPNSPEGETGTSLDHSFISGAFVVVYKILNQSHCESEPGSSPPQVGIQMGRKATAQVQGSKPCNRSCKQTHTAPQTPRSISQPYIHMDSYMASPSRGSWGNWGVEDINLPSTWDPCLKDTKNKLVNIAIYRNRNHFCFQRPLTIPVLDISKTATPATLSKVRPGGWVRHQSPLRLGAPQAPENSSFTSLVPGGGRIFRTLESTGVHPFSPVPGGCLEATLLFRLIYVS